MKRINFLGTLVAIALVFLTCSCSTSKKATTNSPVITPTNDLIPWKETYKTKKGSIVTFTKENILALNFLNRRSTTLSGKLFDQNVEIRDGKAYILNASLQKLIEIPALSTWKVNTTGGSQSEFQRNSGTGSNGMQMTCNMPAQNIKYTFWAYKSGDGTFYLDSKVPGVVVYEGKTYNDIFITESQILYSMNDPDVGFSNN